jgi:hypothetical protein
MFSYLAPKAQDEMVHPFRNKLHVSFLPILTSDNKPRYNNLQHFRIMVANCDWPLPYQHMHNLNGIPGYMCLSFQRTSKRIQTHFVTDPVLQLRAQQCGWRLTGGK